MTKRNRPERPVSRTRATAILIVLSAAIFLEGIDVSMMGVALPSIRADLDMSTGALQWVVSAYVLGYGGFMLLGGRAADLLGRRRVFLAALGVFLVFSGLGGLAPEGWVLIVARFVTGVAAAFMTPAGLSIITTTFAEGRARNQALLVYAGTAAAGFTLGLVVGGLLTEIGWRWVFFAPVILTAALLPAAIRLLPRAEDVPRAASAARAPGARAFDLPGAITVTAAMLLLVFAVVRAPDVPILTTALAALGVAALLTAFVAVERRTAAPLVRLALLRSTPLIRANAGAILLAGAFFGFQFLVALYLQQVRGWSAITAGLALLPAGIDAILAPTLTPRLVARFGTTKVIAAGLATGVAAFALFLPVGLDSGYLTGMLPTMVLVGVTFALSYGPLTIAATDGVREEEQGLASGLLNSSFQFGAALGLAAVTAVLVGVAAEDAPPREQLDGIRTALFVPLAAAVAGLVVTLTGLRDRAPAQAGHPSPA